MTSLHRFLFEQLGRGLTGSLARPAAELRKVGVLEEGKRRGLLRELPLGAVDCPSKTCPDGCVIRPLPAPGKGPGWVRLPCHLGRASDTIVPVEDVTYLECRADRSFAILCRSNAAECLFDANAGDGSPAILVGRIPWAEGACLWFIAAPRRVVGPAELAPVLAHRERPALVLIPPGRIIGALDTHHLADCGIHLLEMERHVDWPLLELDRLAVTVAMAVSGRASVEPATETLVLNVAACEARLHGHKLVLGPREFGVLLALAKTPGRTVRRDDLSDMAYQVKNSLSKEARDDDPGQLNKFVTNIRNAIKVVAAVWGIPDVQPLEIIKARKGVGFCLAKTSVRIEE